MKNVIPESIAVPAEIDIIMPVFNEADNISAVLDSFKRNIRFKYRVMICYDHDADTTLTALSRYDQNDIEFELVKNSGWGVRDAIVSGFARSTAPAVITFPSDDDYNASNLNALYEQFTQGFDIVVASRFTKGGCMQGCPLLKAILVRAASFVSYYCCRIPTRDVTNGLRLFSRRVIEQIPIESSAGWAFSMELLVKCHRMGWPIAEVPFLWFERKSGQSRFRLFHWIPIYMRWLFYSMATTYLGERRISVSGPSPSRDHQAP